MSICNSIFNPFAYRFVAGLMIVTLSPVALAEISVLDDTGHKVTLAAPARRIVSLAPHLTEMLFALEVGNEIVGTSRYSDYPPAARKIPRLGDALSVSVESVVAKKPDVVFAWRSGGSDRALAKIQALGIPVYYSEAARLADIGRSIARMGKLVGKPTRGRELAAAFFMGLSRLRQSPPKSPVAVFFQISDQNLYTVNNRHLIGQAITLCGGENVFGGAAAMVPIVSKEAVLGARPNLIVITRANGSPPSPWEAKWDAYPSLKGKVAYIDPDLISRPGLRMLDGISRLCSLIRQASKQ